MAIGTRILTICLLIALVFVSGCILDFGQNKLDFGNSEQANEALACFCKTYGDPATYTGPPRLIAPLVSTELKDKIPQDKVTRFSTDTNSIFFWVIYQNFKQGEDLHLSWIFQNKVVTTIIKKTGSKTGVAFGEFVRPDVGWPVGTHTIKIEGVGNRTQVTFDISNSPTERTVFDFTGPNGVSCPDLISYIPVTMPVVSTPTTPPEVSTTITQPVASTPVTPTTTFGDYWISGRISNPVLTCNPPNNAIQFMGNTGRAVTPGTKVNLKLFNVPNSGIQDLPLDGVLLGSANIKNDGGWEYTWNGNVNNFPYYLLRNNQQYMVKAILPNGIFTKMSFRYQCPVPTQYLWVSGRISNTELSCDPPNNTLQFSGSTYIAPSGTPVQLKLFNVPNSGAHDLPLDGILIGSTKILNDGSYEFRWNGDVTGYMLKNGQEYLLKAIFPDSGLSAGGNFRYECLGSKNDYSISGRLFNPVFSCYPPNNFIQFLGYTGKAVTPGTPVQLKIFNVPDSGNNDLPRDGVLIGQTTTMNDGSWGFWWDGSVEGFGLNYNQEYMVKVILPDGTYTKVSLPYQCQGTEAINWGIWSSGMVSDPVVLSCSPPNNTIKLMGDTGSIVPPGTPVTLKLFNWPDSGTQEILIGSTNTRNDRSWEYTWNGNVPGYTFKNGQEFMVKYMLPGGRYTKVDFLYQCPTQH